MNTTSLSMIEEIIFKHVGCQKFEAGHGIFMCPLPGGSLRFLHKIFLPTADGPAKIEKALGHPLPQEYRALLNFCNGADLFDNSLFIYGSERNASRSLDLKDQVALPIFDELENMKLLGSLPHNSIIAPIGSVVAATTASSLLLHQSGAVSLTKDDGTAREFDSVLTCLSLLASVLDSLSNDQGLFDESKIQLEQEINALFSVT